MSPYRVAPLMALLRAFFDVVLVEVDAEARSAGDSDKPGRIVDYRSVR
jgi:hypothetical protein